MPLGILVRILRRLMGQGKQVNKTHVSRLSNIGADLRGRGEEATLLRLSCIFENKQTTTILRVGILFRFKGRGVGECEGGRVEGWVSLRSFRISSSRFFPELSGYPLVA